MIVTIDGPAGAGKSTVARRLAERLGFAILDTGSMYRAVTWSALERGIAPDDEAAVTNLANSLRIELAGEDVRVNGREVTRDIRTPRISEHVSAVADHPGVRRRMVELQREIALGGEGFPVDLEQIKRQQTERDRRDAIRPVGALRPADDAIVVDTDSMDVEQVVDTLEKIVRQHRANSPHE
jgi:cytidylate kinase